jgi:fatty-acyl-CoA synthase
MTSTSATERAAAPAAPRNLFWAAMEQDRGTGPQIHCHEDGAYRAVTWDEWRRSAERHAAGLRALGVGPGVRVGCVLTNSRSVCFTILGIWLAGGVIVSLPGMRRGMRPPEYVDQLRRLCRLSDAHLLLLEERFIELLPYEEFGMPLHGYASLAADRRIEPEPPEGAELAFVQFSSGSTSDPKGSLLSMQAICAQEHMLWDRLQVGPHAQGVMWLPLSHDMGLFGCLLLSWVTGMRLAISGGDRFLRKPQTWLEDCADFQANIQCTPNFGLALAARKALKTPPTRGFPLRTVVLGGERIEWDTLKQADEVLGGVGVRLQTLTPAYGLAEATLSVTMKELDAMPHAVTVDGERACSGDLVFRAPGDAGARTFVSCGPPVAGVSLRIEGPGEVGRICIRGPALADGYLEDSEEAEQRFVDGELITEDLGFLHEGELFVLGRTDDVIPIGGRNVHARDVEREVEACGGVRPGCSALVEVVADGVDPQLVLVIESYADDDVLEPLARDAADAAYRAAAVSVKECVFLRAGELPKTPSGKVQRYRCRALAGEHDREAIRRRVPL